MVDYYHIKPPIFNVKQAVLLAGDITSVVGDHNGSMELTTKTTVHVVITAHPNTAADIRLHDLELDLYFYDLLIARHDGLTATSALHVRQGEKYNHYARFIVNQLPVSKDIVVVWRSATAQGSSVELHLHGSVKARIAAFSCMSYKYSAHPCCLMVLEPPPNNTLLETTCDDMRLFLESIV
jgi:hypothetical protein